MIQAKSKCNIPSVRSSPGRGACVGDDLRDVMEKGQGKRQGSVWQAENVHFKYVLLCLRSSSPWLKAVSYRVRSCEHVKSRLAELTCVKSVVI